MQVPKALLEQVMKARINLGEMSHSRCLHAHAAVGTCIHKCVCIHLWVYNCNFLGSATKKHLKNCRYFSAFCNNVVLFVALVWILSHPLISA